jgi:Probable cobalt transporter subunit (CbtB)
MSPRLLPRRAHAARALRYHHNSRRPEGREQQQENIMSDTTFVPCIAAPPIPLREVLPWAIFAALALLAIYFVGAEEGATSLINGMYVHEFVHDGRHLLGFPCH